MSKADVQYQMIEAEFNKLLMCKRGKLRTEEVTRTDVYRRERAKFPRPEFSLDEREKIYIANRKALLKKLKYRNSRELARISRGGYSSDELIPNQNLFTQASLDEYNKELKKLYVHPGTPAWEAKRKEFKDKIVAVENEIAAREVAMEAEFSQKKIELISGVTPIEKFSDVLNELDNTDY